MKQMGFILTLKIQVPVNIDMAMLDFLLLASL